MHSYISYSKLASLYICFAMLHTTLHNETEIIHRKYQKRRIKDGLRSINNSIEKTGANSEENYGQVQLDANDGGRKLFDMIIPKSSEDVLLWPKTGNYVTILYSLDPSLSTSQRRAIPAVLSSIEDHTCIRFIAHPRPCGGNGTKLCFRAGHERAAHLGRRPGEAQSVALAPRDGLYWMLHLVGHVLGLPHPHTCFHGSSSGQYGRNKTRAGCVTHHCPWRRFDPGSALHLTEEELGGWRLPHLDSSALLALWRTRQAARLSHWDRLALHDMYRCWEGRPSCPPPPCRHGGFVDTSSCQCVCPPGFGGNDCRVRTALSDQGGGGKDGCVRHLSVGTELELPISELAELGTTPTEQCVLRVRTFSQRLQILARLDGAHGELSKMSTELNVVLSSEAIMCAIKMYVFQNGSPTRTFCILDYIGEALSLNVASHAVELLFSSDPSLSDTRRMLQRTRLAVRSAGALSKNLTGNSTAGVTMPVTTVNTTAASTDTPVVEKGQMRSAAGGVPFVDLIILPPILFTLMGFNILVVFCIKKYWEYRYGTAGIYRGTEGSYWSDEDEEEPEDWQVKVEYSESFDGVSPIRRETAGESSLPQSEMTDLELFQIMYGVPGNAPPDVTEEKRFTQPADVEAAPLEEKAGNLTSLLRAPSSKTKKRVSFSDDIGKPLHVQSDALLGNGGKSPAPTTSTEQSPLPATQEEVRTIVPFSDNAQLPPTAGNDDTDSEEGSEESSCCDSSSSSSYHEDEDDPNETEPGLLHGLTQCFRKQRDNESSEI